MRSFHKDVNVATVWPGLGPELGNRVYRHVLLDGFWYSPRIVCIWCAIPHEKIALIQGHRDMKQGVCGETRGKKDKDIGGDNDRLLSCRVPYQMTSQIRNTGVLGRLTDNLNNQTPAPSIIPSSPGTKAWILNILSGAELDKLNFLFQYCLASISMSIWHNFPWIL